MLEHDLNKAVEHCISCVQLRTPEGASIELIAQIFFDALVLELEITGYDYPIFANEPSVNIPRSTGVFWHIVTPFICDGSQKNYRCGVELYVNNSCKIAAYKNFIKI
ncbi:hypothetical protein [Shewanella sp. TC10]|uniref:hypothetical protein n=1 Tax=Shewanella sp. TC10 TaxID=1419739 RepID=UPI00129E5B8A|nr:hypothetical protein [Shewanella sp. TC10]